MPFLRSSLKFQGKQIYGTICSACNHRSEQISDFLEIEISFEAGYSDTVLCVQLIPGFRVILISRIASQRSFNRRISLRIIGTVVLLYCSLLYAQTIRSKILMWTMQCPARCHSLY